MVRHPYVPGPWEAGVLLEQVTGTMFCGLLGSHEPFDAARLAMLYPTHDGYVAKVKEATEKNLKWGYLLKPDAEATIEEARRSTVGKK